MEFADSWLWFVFVLAGLLMCLLELLVGVETGYDLVFTGTACIVGGLIAWPFESWPVVLVASGTVSASYVLFGRRYLHRKVLAGRERTNVDAIVGRKGVVLERVADNDVGLVRVGYERWRARADAVIQEGEEVVVTGVSGVTLTVERSEGGD